MDNSLAQLLESIRIKIDTNPVSALEPAQEALSLCLQQNNPDILAESYYLVGMSLREVGKSGESIQHFEAAEVQLTENSPAFLKVYIYSVLAIEHAIRYNKQESLNYINLCKTLLSKTEGYKCRIVANSRICGALVKMSFYVEALEILLGIVVEIKDKITFRDEAYIYSHLSIVQSRMKNYEEALVWSKKAEQSFKDIFYERGIISILINRSMIYYYGGQMNKGVTSLLRAEMTCTVRKDKFKGPLGIIYMNLGNCLSHKSLARYEEALDYLGKSYQIARSNNVGNLICLSLACSLRCIAKIDKKVPDFLADEYSNGIAILEDAVDISKKIDDPLVYKEIYESAVVYLEASDNYKDAFLYQKKLTELNEFISEREKDENLFALNIKYETTQKEIKVRQLELEKKELELQQKEELREINKNLENKVRERTSELIAKNNELEQYAYIVAHDLKEPIRSIVGFSQLLEKRASEELSDKTKELLQFVINASYDMREMVDDLLRYSTIQVSREKFKEVDINGLIERVLISLQTTITENNAKIIVGELPEFIVGDGLRIRQLFQNIISNAIKFRHPERQPIINISGEQTEEGYTFKIQDNGIGIDQEFHEKIFMLFRRLHTKEKFRGSGIGLSVCKKIISLHGGKIWVTSEEGIGTTFHFTLA